MARVPRPPAVVGRLLDRLIHIMRHVNATRAAPDKATTGPKDARAGVTDILLSGDDRTCVAGSIGRRPARGHAGWDGGRNLYLRRSRAMWLDARPR